jgi:antitoxin component of MazEF toxin-antitoxin module
MIKHLTKHGNSLALVIDRWVLELLEISADTPLSLTTNGQCLVVTPVRNAKRRKLFRAALEKVNKRYRLALKRLAD